MTTKTLVCPQCLRDCSISESDIYMDCSSCGKKFLSDIVVACDKLLAKDYVGAERLLDKASALELDSINKELLSGRCISYRDRTTGFSGYLGIAQRAIKNGKVQIAEDCLKRSLEINSKNAGLAAAETYSGALDICIELAFNVVRQKELDRAIGYLERAIELATKLKEHMGEREATLRREYISFKYVQLIQEMYGRWGEGIERSGLSHEQIASYLKRPLELSQSKLAKNRAAQVYLDLANYAHRNDLLKIAKAYLNASLNLGDWHLKSRAKVLAKSLGTKTFQWTITPIDWRVSFLPFVFSIIGTIAVLFGKPEYSTLKFANAQDIILAISVFSGPGIFAAIFHKSLKVLFRYLVIAFIGSAIVLNVAGFIFGDILSLICETIFLGGLGFLFITTYHDDMV